MLGLCQNIPEMRPWKNDAQIKEPRSNRKTSKVDPKFPLSTDAEGGGGRPDFQPLGYERRIRCAGTSR